MLQQIAVHSVIGPKKITVVPVSYHEKNFHGFGSFLLGDFQ
jgi:hypothetical protein